MSHRAALRAATTPMEGDREREADLGISDREVTQSRQ
jgi:hypothetical protein